MILFHLSLILFAGTDSPAEKSQANSDSITFELYLKEAAEVRARTRASGVAQPQLEGPGDLTAVERRIAALENALGEGGRLGVTGVGFGEKSQVGYEVRGGWYPGRD